MKEYFKKFGVLFIILAVLLAVAIGAVAMSGLNVFVALSIHRIAPSTIFLAAAVVTGVYLVSCISAHKGRKTTVAETYVSETGKPALHSAQDIFITKRTSSRRLDNNRN